MQSSREVVEKAIHFKGPDRIPVQFDSLGISDTHYVGWNQIGAGDKNKKETYDEWHCKWTRTEQENMGQVVEHPLLNWNNIDKYDWPDSDNNDLYQGMENKFKGYENKYILTGIFMLLFERIHSLRGFENTLTDFYLNKKKIGELADRIVEYNIRIIQNISERFGNDIHGFSFTDDWGTEESTIISIKLWNEFFRPRYQKIFDAIKQAGWDVWMHSCGKINKLIPFLIDIGCDVLNLQQPTTNGIKEIGEKFTGNICFSSLCDIQHTLPFKSEEEIEKEAQKLMTYWGTDRGGFILSDYGDGRAIGVDKRTKNIMFDAFIKHDRWK